MDCSRPASKARNERVGFTSRPPIHALLQATPGRHPAGPRAQRPVGLCCRLCVPAQPRRSLAGATGQEGTRSLCRADVRRRGRIRARTPITQISRRGKRLLACLHKHMRVKKSIAPAIGKRRSFSWPNKARDLARANRNARGHERYQLIASLARMTGHPRNACLRFARRCGVIAKRPYRNWSSKEADLLLQLSRCNPLPTVARKLPAIAAGHPGDAGAAWDQDRQGRLDQVRACVFPACTAAHRTEVGGPGMAEGSQGKNREAAPAGD